MPKLDIVLYPEPVLTTPAQPVEKVDDEIRALVDNMVETMYDAPGIGLAAPQIGRSVRVCICDISNPQEGEAPDLRVLINPEIVEASGNIAWEEGCLSMPGLYREVKRHASVVVEALDRDGVRQRYEAEHLLAVCMQHEIDHLDGIMFIDHLSRLKKRLALKEWRRLKAQYLARAEDGEDAEQDDV